MYKLRFFVLLAMVLCNDSTSNFSCPANQTISPCGNHCQLFCDNLNSPCPHYCGSPACACFFGYAFSKDHGTCVLKSDCPKHQL